MEKKVPSPLQGSPETAEQKWGSARTVPLSQLWAEEQWRGRNFTGNCHEQREPGLLVSPTFN